MIFRLFSIYVKWNTIVLYLNNFEILKTIDRKTYAYDTYVIVAKAIHNYLIANRYFFKVNIANFHNN
jgi:hypothetical protein